MEFNPGDVVRLKSSGPRMTISSISVRAKLGAQTVQCEWFNQVDRSYELKSASFAVHTLLLVESSSDIESKSKEQ